MLIYSHPEKISPLRQKRRFAIVYNIKHLALNWQFMRFHPVGSAA